MSAFRRLRLLRLFADLVFSALAKASGV